MLPTELHKWVNEAKRGHQTAWNFLYNYFHPFLFSKALNICGNTPAAKDAVQETFMISFLQLDKLRDPQAFPAWINKILTHNCYRHSKRENNYDKEELLLHEQDIDFEKKLDQLYNKQRLFDSLEQLPESLKTTLLLRYFSKHNSYTDIAKILSVPVGTIRSRLNKARLALSEQWQKCSGESNTSSQSEEWNDFYFRVFQGYLANQYFREKMLNHLGNDLQIKLTSGKQVVGKDYIAKGIESDIIHGIRVAHINVISCGEVSVIEFNNINSAEFPDHCPVGTAMVAYRDKEKMTRLNLHDSPG